MAGEDPGVGVITLLLDLIQRGWAAVTGTAKSIVSGAVDILKTSLFFSWRRKMMQGQKGPDLKHGEQSLKDLRLHEQVGAKIVTVEIGDEVVMEALRQELKRLELDFAITEHDDQYTLHYKDVNEQDVLYAQQVALEKLYGEHEQETPNEREEREQQDQQDRDEGQDKQDRQDDGRDRDEREERERDERREERERDEEEPDPQQEQNQDQSDQRDNHDQDDCDEQERQNQQDREQHNSGQRDEQAPEPVPVLIEAGESPSNERASRGKHARQEAPALAERMPTTPSQSQQVLKTQVQTKDAPQFEPLENIIAQARERAAAKNAGRSHAMERTKDRIRAREVSFGH